MNVSPYARKAQYYETDLMGVIHHSNYIRWFEESRVHLMDQIGFGYDRVEAEGISFALLGLSCEYKATVLFGDTVLIQPWVSSCSHSRMAVSYRITDAASGELKTEGETRHCFFRKQDGRPVSLKKTIPELYDLLCRLVEKV